MTLVDVQEFTATNKDASQLVSPTSQNQALLKSTVQNVKMYMPHNLDTRKVSFSYSCAWFCKLFFFFFSIAYMLHFTRHIWMLTEHIKLRRWACYFFLFFFFLLCYPVFQCSNVSLTGIRRRRSIFWNYISSPVFYDLRTPQATESKSELYSKSIRFQNPQGIIIQLQISYSSW